jgi:hypothetical protein
MNLFTKKNFTPQLALILLMSIAIPWSGIYAQENKKKPATSIDKSEGVKKAVKKNGPQPTRYNQKKLVADPTSEFYDATHNGAPIDNVEERFNFEFERLKDPTTGEIPTNIRDRELLFVKSAASGLQRSPDEVQLQRGDIDPSAAGDQQSPWVNRGPYNVGGRTRALAMDLDDENIILAGGVSGGMWRTIDQGANWTRVTAGDQHPGITDVVQDPRVGFHDTWYYSTGERLGSSQGARNGAAFYQGNGIYKSIDNGLTWTLLTATQNLTPESFDNPFDLTFGLAIHPTTGDLYVATFDGLQRSNDGGTTFSEVLPAEFDNFSDIHIASNGVIYAALDNGGGVGGIYRTTDGALGTWTNITDASFPATFGRTVIYTAPSAPETLYILASGTATSPVSHDFWKYTYVSGDGSGAGGTWVNRSANLPDIGGNVGSFDSQGGYDLFVRVHPTDPDFVLIGGTNIYRSTDGFATAVTSASWIAGYSPLNNVSLYTNHHPDQHSLLFLPSDPNKVISGHDGGISMTNDITATTAGTEPVAWTSLNNGYLTTQIYALSIGPTDQLMAGFQDNSTWFTNNDTPTDPWVDVNSGDGSYNAINADGTLRYMSSQAGNIRRGVYADANSSTSINSTGIAPAASGVSNGNYLFIAPFEMDPNDDETLYMAQNTNLWRNDDLPNATTTIGWTAMVNATTPSNISTIGISESPANVVYIGTTGGQVYRIDDANVGNPAAIDIFTGKGLPTGNVASIDVNPFDSNDVIIAFSNYSILSIFRSINGGSTWTDISGNLEENLDGSGAGPSVRWVATVGNGDRYFAGTSTGLYSTATLDGTSTNWTQEDLAGITNTVVEQIRVRDSDGLVVLGTHGNGIYSATFEVTDAPVTVVNAISAIEVDANSANTIIDVSAVFESNLIPAQPITVSIEDNSNTGVLSASILGDMVTLDYVTDAFGSATITLRGQDTDGNFAFSIFEVTVSPPPVTTFPYTQHFDDGILPVNWETSGAMSWLVDVNGTPSSGTGPLVDHTLMDATGSYIYSEASSLNQGDEAILLTRKIDLNTLTDPSVNFAYHMFGADMGTLTVDVIDVTDPDPLNHTTTQVFTISGQQQAQADPYLIATVDLSAFASSIIQLTFTSVRGAGFTSDVALDDISVESLPSDDLAITDILSTPVIKANAATEVTIEITNLGTQSQSGFDVNYQIPGQSIVTEVFAGTIASLESEMYTFTTTYMESTLGDVIYDVSVDLAGDTDTGNNQQQFEGVVLSGINVFPYAESFEADNGSWFSGGVNSSFELGAPAATNINAASDGTQAWVTNLTGNYNQPENSYVISPIFDLTALVDPTILLDIMYLTEEEYDGVVLQSSINFGATWENVGVLGDQVNWFDMTNLGSLNFAGAGTDSWSGTSNGYVTASHALDGLAGEGNVILRIAFGSDGSVDDE